MLRLWQACFVTGRTVGTGVRRFGGRVPVIAVMLGVRVTARLQERLQPARLQATKCVPSSPQR